MNQHEEDYEESGMAILEPREQFDVAILGVNHYEERIIYDAEKVKEIIKSISKGITDEEAWRQMEVFRGSQDEPIFLWSAQFTSDDLSIEQLRLLKDL